MLSLILVASLVPGIMAKPMNHKHARNHAKNSTDVITKTTVATEPTEFAAILDMRNVSETGPATNVSLTMPPITVRRSQTSTSTIGVLLETEAPEVDGGLDFLNRKRFDDEDGLLPEATASTSEEDASFAVPSETVTVDLPLETDDLAMTTEDALSLSSATITSIDLAVETEDSAPALPNEKRQLLDEALPTDGPVLPSTSLPTELPSTTAALVLPTKAPNATVPSSAMECKDCIEYCKDEDGLPSFPCLKKCLDGCQKEVESDETKQRRRAISNLPIPSIPGPAIPSGTATRVGLPTTVSGIALPSASGLSGCQSCALDCVVKNGGIPSLLLCIQKCIPVCDAATKSSVAIPPATILPAL